MSGQIRPAGCPALEQLKSFVDGELPAAEEPAVAKHVLDCGYCSEEIEAMKVIGSELKRLEGTAVPPAELRQRILSRIFVPPARQRVAAWLAVQWGSLAALAALGLLIAALLFPVYAGRREAARNASTSSSLPRRAADWSSRPGSPAADKATQSAAGAPQSRPVASAPAGGQPLMTLRQRAELPSVASSGSFGSRATTGTPARPDALPQDSTINGQVTDGGIGGRRNGSPYADGHLKSAGRLDPSIPTGSAAISDVDRYARGKLEEGFGRKVFQSGDLSVRVDRKLESEQDEIAGHLKKAGGYVEDSSLSSPATGQERVAEMVLRVPVEQFESTISWLSGLGEVTAKKLEGKDVTGRWIDERAELRELRKEETRLSKELDQAKKPAVIQELRWQLLRLRPRIAAAEERFAATTKLATLATIRLKLLEEPQARVRGNLMEDMDRTARSAVSAFLIALRVPAAVLIWLLVFTPLWLPCVLLYRWASRRLAEEARRSRTEGLTADPTG